MFLGIMAYQHILGNYRKSYNIGDTGFWGEEIMFCFIRFGWWFYNCMCQPKFTELNTKKEILLDVNYIFKKNGEKNVGGRGHSDSS